MKLEDKKAALDARLRSMGRILLAYSGGVDSTLLLKISHHALKDRVVAVTADSPIHPSREKSAAIDQAKRIGVQHIIIPSRELSHPDFIKNGVDRCYVCKKSLFDDLWKIAGKMGIPHLIHGANADDLNDFRPGFRAAEEMGVVAPLLEAGLGKAEVRELSKRMHLSTWDKPAMACLASRIPYGTRLTKQRLQMVDMAESILLDEGFRECRVRHHESVARIEVPETEMHKLLNPMLRRKMTSKMREIGFSHIAVDLAGYVQGSMNRGII